MKKALSLLLTALLVLSSFSFVFAAEVPTLTIGDVDATAITDGGYFAIPVTIDKFPDGSLKIVQLDFTFDKSKLSFMGAYTMNADASASSMKVYDKTGGPLEAMWKLADASWSSTEAGTVNANGYGTILFSDSTGTNKNFTAEKSLAASNILVYIWFTRNAGVTGTTTVDFSNVILTDTAVTTSGASYEKSTGAVNVVAGSVKLTEDVTPKSDNANITALKVTNGSDEYVAAVDGADPLKYTVTVPSTVAEVTVVPTLSDSKASVTDPASMTSGTLS